MEKSKLKPDILILGKSAVALSAIKTIRARDEKIDISVVSKEEGPFYSPVLLPYYISGEIAKKELFALGEDFFDKKAIKTYFSKKIERLRAKDKIVLLDDGMEIGYENLIIGTGASPYIPPIKGIENKGVFSLRTLKDADLILEHLGGQVVVLGAGAVAIGIAIALRKKGHEVSMIYRKGLPYIIGGRVDLEIAKEVLCNLEKNGVRVIFDQDPEEMEIFGDPVQGILGTNIELSCDTIIVATGVSPNSDFISPKEISLGERRRIIVDDRMMTSAKNAYAAGDCIEGINFVTGMRESSPIWPNAIEQGKVAALNALGIKCRYQGFIKKNVINLFDNTLFIAGEMYGERKCYEDNRKTCRIITKDGTVTGCQVLGNPEKFGVYLGMIKKRQAAEKLTIPIKGKRKLYYPN
jgi:NAD(P)H-nitrite reductase large subunit